MARKMSAWLIVHQDDGEYSGQWIPTKKITCEVTGEMDTGTKVWTDIETGEQYFLLRMQGKYMFYKE